jgi:hypothetical protein
MAIDVRRGELSIFPCECCGHVGRTVHGFVLRGDSREGLYLARAVRAGDAVALDVALGLSDGSTVAVRVESDGVRARMRLVRPESSALHPARTLGRWLTLQDAAFRVEEIRPLVEAVVARDARLLRALDLPPPTRRERVA